MQKRMMVAVAVLLTLGLLGLVACDQPVQPTPNASVNTKTEIKKDANGNVTEKTEKTEVKTNTPSSDNKTAGEHADDAGTHLKEGMKDVGKATGEAIKDAGEGLKDASK